MTFLPLLYNFGGVMKNTARAADMAGPGGIYYVRVAVSMFAPFLSISAYQPARRGRGGYSRNSSTIARLRIPEKSNPGAGPGCHGRPLHRPGILN